MKKPPRKRTVYTPPLPLMYGTAGMGRIQGPPAPASTQRVVLLLLLHNPDADGPWRLRGDRHIVPDRYQVELRV